MANLFEQTVLLTAQTYNSLAYQCRINVLLTLDPNSTKVKEILKEQSLELDVFENKCLFWEKFEEKLSKITTVKQRSKKIFTGLQKSSTATFPPSHQPFRAGPLSQSNLRGIPGGTGRRGSLFQRAAFRRGKSYSYQITLEGGNTAPKDIFSNPSIHKNFVDVRELGKSASCWPSKVFSGKLEETDKRPFHFEGSSGISNTPIIRTHSIFFPFRSLNETGGTDSCRSGDRKNVGKTSNKTSTTLKRPVSEYPFRSHQKRHMISSSD